MYNIRLENACNVLANSRPLYATQRRLASISLRSAEGPLSLLEDTKGGPMIIFFVSVCFAGFKGMNYVSGHGYL